MPRAVDLQVGFGRAVELRREELKLSQKALAGRCGMGNTAISHLESGRGNPELETICRIANGLEMPPSFLLASAEDLLPPSGTPGPGEG